MWDTTWGVFNEDSCCLAPERLDLTSPYNVYEKAYAIHLGNKANNSKDYGPPIYNFSKMNRGSWQSRNNSRINGDDNEEDEDESDEDIQGLIGLDDGSDTENLSGDNEDNNSKQKPLYLKHSQPNVVSLKEIEENQSRVSNTLVGSSTSPQPMTPTLLMQQKADIFSLGCVLAELFLDGRPLFTLSTLTSYKKGEIDAESISFSFFIFFFFVTCSSY
jgi:hypothetical protein